MQENYIKKIEIGNLEGSKFLANIEGLKKLNKLILTKPITFFTGENGTGKSTLIEAIAIYCGFNPEGGSKNFNFKTSDTHLNLHEYMQITRSAKREKDGFFLKAESFYTLATYAESVLDDFSEYGEKPLHQQSHGESFLNLINHRFRGNGLYILDEPESALSLQRQLSLLVSIHDLVRAGSQFIIATHSPILLGMPEAQIISFDADKPINISYEETTAYEISSLYFENRDLLFERLFKDDN